jgi:hypothetical protein
VIERASRNEAIAVALFVALALPFLGRAHHIDDPLYLRVAAHIGTQPLDPLGAPTFWHGVPARAFDDLYNPPLVSYLLAIPRSIAGDAEIAVHAFMAALAVLALLAWSRLAAHEGLDDRVVLLLATSPVLLLAATSAMADVPFLLISLLGWTAARRGRDVPAGAWAAASWLTKYSGAMNVVAAMLTGPAARRMRVLGTAALLAAVWCAWNLKTQGVLHALYAGRLQDWRVERLIGSTASFVAALGIAGAPALLMLVRWRRTTLLSAALAGALGGGVVWSRTESLASAGVALVAFAGGAALLAAAAMAMRRSIARGEVFWPALFVLHGLFAALFVYFGAARYVLPLLPPLLWLLARESELALTRAPRVALAVGLGARTSYGLALADAGYANVWRAAARKLPATERGFSTGRWGFDFYANRRGYRPLTPREDLRPGDVLALPEGIDTVGPWPAQRARLRPLSALVLPSPRLRVMDAAVDAGLYSSAWGWLPIAWRPGAVERVALARVERWPDTLKAANDGGPVSVELGAEDGAQLRLDGWSDPEAFVDGGGRVRFIWAQGAESALRLPLPDGLTRVRLRVSPDAAAVGPLDIAVGARQARVALEPGWRWYDAALDGPTEGGPTLIVLRPRGHRRVGAFDRERRPLSFAVHRLAFGEGDAERTRGTWPVSVQSEPALAVAGTALQLASEAHVRGSVCVRDGRVVLRAGLEPFDAARCPCDRQACRFEMTGDGAWKVDASEGAAVLRLDAR